MSATETEDMADTNLQNDSVPQSAIWIITQKFRLPLNQHRPFLPAEQELWQIF